MLEIAENNTQYKDLLGFNIQGLCDIFSTIFGFYPYETCDFDYEDKSIHGFEYYLPELWAKRTTDDWFEEWFEDFGYIIPEYWEVRKRVLIECIEETEN